MKNLLKKLLVMLPMLAAGFVCGLLIGKYALEAESRGLPGGMFSAIALLFAGFVLALYLQTAVHEAGHLVCGLLTGYQFCSYRLGSLMLLREDGQFKLRRLKIAGTAGQCLMAPPPWSENLPVILYNLGGCLFNLLLSVLCLLLWLPLREHWLGALPLVTALGGFAMALTNGIPMRMGGVDNDGRNALHLGHDAVAKRAFWLQMKVSEAQAKGLRLYQMPEIWFAWPQEGMENPLVATIAVFSCNRLMDQCRFSEAQEAMEKLLAQKTGILGLHRNLLHCDLLYCRLQNGQAEAAKQLLTRELLSFMKTMKAFPSVIRTQYALAVADGHQEKVQACRKAFEKVAKTYPYPAEIQSERELLALADRAGSTV